MAMVCARCGTANPDGNRFCQSCGAELAAAPPVAAVPVGSVAASPFTQPPPAYTPPPAAPPAVPPLAPPPYYQSPYYAPGAGAMQPAVHRTPWVMIVAVVVALVLVMAGVGAVLAVGLSHSSGQATTLSELSSPSPAVTPSAHPTSVPSALPTPSGPDRESNAGVTVTVPDGWAVAASDNESITLTGPNSDGSITIASGSSTPPQTAQQNVATVDAFFKQQYPDTKACNKTTTGSLNGVAGISWELCFTITGGGQSASAAALLFVGANSDGSIYYAMYMLSLASNIQNFAKEAAPVIKGITWNLK